MHMHETNHASGPPRFCHPQQLTIWCYPENQECCCSESKLDVIRINSLNVKE